MNIDKYGQIKSNQMQRKFKCWYITKYNTLVLVLM